MAVQIPVNGEVVVTVLSDDSAAFFTLYPPQNGGREVTAEDVFIALAQKNVKYNIDAQLIQSAVSSRSYDREFRAASADMPVNGKDGTVTYMFAKENIPAPKEDEQGFVDYKNLGHIRNIRENETIAEITMPEDGRDGMNVKGVVMKALPGKPAKFTVGSGTKLSDDGLRIFAACDGHICFKNGGFCVESAVTIGGDVDSSIGNLDFLGDIVIKGEVMEGFSVTAGKSITIGGNVTGATLKAGSEVTIKKGCINSSVTAHGDINCKFCEHSKLSTDLNITAQSFVICDVYCGGDLTAKTLGGGKYTVLGNAEVGDMGTKNYAPTELVAGDNAVLTKEKEASVKKISELDVSIDRCTQIVEFLNEKRKQLKGLPEDKEELLGSMVKTKLANQMEKKNLKKRIAEIEEALASRQYRAVTVKGTAYPGVRVTINDASMKIEHETTRVKIYQDDEGNIVTGVV